MRRVTEDCVGCTPGIDPSSVIEAVPGLRAAVELLPTYGNCSTAWRGYSFFVAWGDGIYSSGNYTAMDPVSVRQECRSD